jgi:hypothetical protein
LVFLTVSGLSYIYGSVEAEENYSGMRFFRYSLSDSLTTDSTKTITASDKNITAGAQLKKKGTIYRGIKAGSETGAGIVSGFNLEISGNVSENVSVEANISDDKLSVSDESSTEMLSEIENIYIEFRHPNLTTRIGDFKADNVSGQFGGLNKKASGIMATAIKSNHSITGFLSAEGSSFASDEFIAADGITGPYILKTVNNSRPAVIRDSEVLYMNGIKLERGTQYFFDYDLSQFFLKPELNFREGDRITVDYQFSSEDYKQTSYGFRTHDKLFDGKMEFKTEFYQEEDRKGSPLNFDLSSENELLLADSGSDHVWISGAELSIGGDYELMADSMHYMYAGEGKGDYEVRFTFFETGGEYYRTADSLGALIYVYDPVNGGDYMPLIKLNAPEKYSRLHALADYRSRYFSLESEVAASSYNRNTFASDELDFNGLGIRNKFNLKTPDSKIGRAGISFEVLNRNRHLKLPVRMEKLKRDEEVRLHNVSEAQSYTLYEGGVSYDLGKITNNLFRMSYAETGGGLKESGASIITSGVSGNYGYNGSLHFFEAVDDSIRNEKTTLNISGSYTGEIWEAEPFFKFSEEKSGINEPVPVLKDERFGALLLAGNKDKTLLRVRSEYSAVSDFTGGRERRYLDRHENSLNLKIRSGTVFNSESYWVNTLKYYESSDSTDTRYDRVGIKANYNKGSFFSNFFEYETEMSRFEPKVRTYYRVEDGTGTHRLTNGEFYPDDFGDHRYYITYSGKASDVTGVKLGMRTTLDPRGISENTNILYWLSQLDITNELKISEKSRTGNKEDLILLMLDSFQNDSTVHGLIETVTKADLMKNKKISLSYTHTFSKMLDRQFTNYSENSRFQSHELAINNRSGAYNHKVTGKISSYDRYGYSGDIRTAEISKQAFGYEITQSLNGGSYYSAASEYGFEKDGIGGFVSESISLAPVASFRVTENGMLRSFCKVVRIFSDRSLPYYMNSSMNRGWNSSWSLNGDYLIGKDIKGTLVYTGRKYSHDDRPFHEMRLEFQMNL